MKSRTVKTKVVAALIALTFIGGTAAVATNAQAKDLLNEDATIITASSKSYDDSDRHSRDSRHEKEERGKKGSKHEQDERRSNDSDDGKNYDAGKAANITLEEAIKIATEDTKGEVIKVEFERGRYEVKIRTKDGYKKEIYVSARDGVVVKRK